MDTDSLAVRSSIANRNLNNFEASRMQIKHGSNKQLKALLQGDSSDLLLCNILASVIEKLVPCFRHLVSPNGTVLLSGLLVNQAPPLMSLLETQGWQIISFVEQDGWGLLEAHRN